MSGTGDPGEAGALPLSLNRAAVVGLVVSVAVAAGAMFALPWLVGLGLSFYRAFLLIGILEFVAALIAGLSVYFLYIRRQ